MKTKTTLLSFICLIFIFSGKAQTPMVDGLNTGSFNKITINCKPMSVTQINTGFPITGLSVLFPPDYSFDGSYIVTEDNDTFPIFQEDEEMINRDKIQANISRLILFDKPLSRFYFSNNTLQTQILFHTYYVEAEETPDRHTLSKRRATDCSKPVMVDQSEWRNGLTPPANSPEYTKPDHIIIHHSVTPNYANKLQVVRSIYIKHTETNGWNDIAYNYLIARDGTIYKGRDDQGIYDEDFVKGAHFCKKNSNTLGVCLIGTYNEEAPTPEAWQALKELMAWKLFKDKMNPADSFIHPKDTGSRYLGVIAGHRDGCTTDCPGDSVYPRIPDLRFEMKTIVDNCDKTNSLSTSSSKEFYVYPGLNHDQLVVSSKTGKLIKSIELLSLNGKVLMHREYSGMNTAYLHIGLLTEGIYFLRICTLTSVENIQFIKTHL